MGNIIEWISSITESFTNNLIAEDRYRKRHAGRDQARLPCETDHIKKEIKTNDV